VLGDRIHSAAAEHEIGRSLGVSTRGGRLGSKKKSDPRPRGQHSPNTTSMTLVPLSPGRSNAPTASSAG
jgi:hypothetical protein